MSRALEVLDRLRTERLDLGMKIQKLQAFLPTPQFRELSGPERELLIAQNEVMCRYAGILTQRERILEQKLGGL